MNCKPGDLAVVIRSGGYALKVGSIVRCIDFVPAAMNIRTGEVLHDVWNVEYRGETRGFNGAKLGAPDRCLKPLRDGTGDDETLAWKSVPSDKIGHPKHQRENTR